MEATATKTKTGEAGGGRNGGASGWVVCLSLLAMFAVTAGIPYLGMPKPKVGPDQMVEAGRYQANLLAERGALRDPSAARSSANAVDWPFGRSNVDVEAQAPFPGAPAGVVDVAAGRLPHAACAALGEFTGPGRPVAAASVNGTGFGSGAAYRADACVLDFHSKHGLRARNVVVLRVERGSAGSATVLPK